MIYIYIYIYMFSFIYLTIFLHIDVACSILFLFSFLFIHRQYYIGYVNHHIHNIRTVLYIIVSYVCYIVFVLFFTSHFHSFFNLILLEGTRMYVRMDIHTSQLSSSFYLYRSNFLTPHYGILRSLRSLFENHLALCVIRLVVVVLVVRILVLVVETY